MLIGYWRLLVASFILSFAIYTTSVLNTPELNYLYVVVGVFIVLHFLFGPIQSAYKATKKGNWQKAHQLLNTIWLPQLLLKQNKAYYHFIKGMLLLQNKQTTPAKTDLKEALRLKLPQVNDRAIAQLNLAHIAYVEKDWQMTKEYLIAAKQQNSDEEMIQKGIIELEKTLRKENF